MKNELNKRIAHLEIPDRIRRLPISDEGYPVPYFVGWINDKPDFRSMDGEKLAICVRLKRCWLCGQPLGIHMTFPIGPMCMVTRVIAEPPSHHSCAEYGVKACPFLTEPRMRRNTKNMVEGAEYTEGAILRNPGVIALWTTQSYKVQRARGHGVHFLLGEPEKVEFYREGRMATRTEILESIDSGLPILRAECQRIGPEAIAELEVGYPRALALLPAEAPP